MALKDIFGGEAAPPARKGGLALIFGGEEEESSGKIPLTKAKFRDENRRCSLCEYYEEEKNGCSKVEGVDFDKSDPDLSSCGYFEGKESAGTEEKEKEEGKEVPEEKQAFGEAWKKDRFG